jgi:V-type H+-transporting ATPase subunit H
MVVAKLLQFVKVLSARKWTDREIVEDLSFLQDELQASFDQLTYLPRAAQKSLPVSGLSMSIHPSLNWDFYSGHLLIAVTISGGKMPPKLTEENNKLLKVLAKLLSTSKNPLVLAVGCHDVRQLVKQVPQARSYTPRFCSN